MGVAKLSLPPKHFYAHFSVWENSGEKKDEQFGSVSQSCLIICDLMDHRTPGFPVHHQLSELAQTLFHRVDAIQPPHPLLSPSPTLNLSQHQGLFKWVSSSHLVAKYWNFSLSINPPNEYSGLISFRIDWFDLLAIQGALKSLLQHHSSKVSIFQCSAFFMVQLSQPHITTEKPEIWPDRPLSAK